MLYEPKFKSLISERVVKKKNKYILKNKIDKFIDSDFLIDLSILSKANQELKK